VEQLLGWTEKKKPKPVPVPAVAESAKTKLCLSLRSSGASALSESLQSEEPPQLFDEHLSNRLSHSTMDRLDRFFL
jgi:hypothetical protein